MDFFKVLFFEKIGATVAYSGKDWEALFAAGVGGYPIATITGSPPLYFIADGSNLTDYTISGNTVQNGTPTPEAPVDVVGCGVRTGNLFDKNNVLDKYRVGAAGELVPDDSCVLSDFISVNANTVYSQNTSFSYYNAVAEYSDSKEFIVRYISGDGTFTTSANTKYIRMSSGRALSDARMLNLGSTPLPYEPYGIKLPLTVNGTEYPIYLGQVETTRKIKKLVLTGGETFGYGNSCFTYTFDNKPISVQPVKTVIISNAYKGIEPKYRDQLRNYECCITINYNQIAIRDDNYTDVADFKSYLAAQYANGTPVTVWYVLANPETGIVNEPLHKIGDYADTISFAQAEVAIPTSDGDNTISFGTTVQPSSVSITGHIKPTTP